MHFDLLLSQLVSYKNTAWNHHMAALCIDGGVNKGGHGVRTVMENLEKSWNFKMVISRAGKVMEKT